MRLVPGSKMKIDLGRMLRRYFPGSFEMIVVGITFILLSTTGIGMIFDRRDTIFPHMFASVRLAGIVWACVMVFLGFALIFGGVRHSATPGTMAYRVTHPWGS